ncbi:MAG: ATP-dependent 6-phosphofructokinase [Sandaracinaceae bacterium]|nr:ATP-dependent 6-phosphofructokinase [Sandaracinaceae bacterium]
MRRSVAPDPSGDRHLNVADLEIAQLGPCTVPSPNPVRDLFVDEDDTVCAYSDMQVLQQILAEYLPLPGFEPAGAREQLFFDPKTVRCAIVTCGGLCPGQNDVIRSIYLTLRYTYGVEHLLGFPYGYAGLAKDSPFEPIPLTKERVNRIHGEGGTILGSSRGAPTVPEMVDTLQARGIDVLFTIGGDGTLRGAAAITAEVARRGAKIAVIGVPKTIDNDLLWVERSFGFATAVDEARRAISGAHVEARGAFNGIGMVKLMGRHSGFIAAHACLSNSDVNFCLVPEVPFELEGEGGFLTALERRLERAQHAVIVVAEGAGQDLLKTDGPVDRDASGNVKLVDIGSFLKTRIAEHFGARGVPVSLKYIDPSYIVRSLRANALDAELCLMFGQYAVHAAMAGRTGMSVSYWNQRFTHVPFNVMVGRRKQLDPDGELWQAVLGATGQPDLRHRRSG